MLEGISFKESAWMTGIQAEGVKENLDRWETKKSRVCDKVICQEVETSCGIFSPRSFSSSTSAPPSNLFSLWRVVQSHHRFQQQLDLRGRKEISKWIDQNDGGNEEDDAGDDESGRGGEKCAEIERKRVEAGPPLSPLQSNGCSFPALDAVSKRVRKVLRFSFLRSLSECRASRGKNLLLWVNKAASRIDLKVRSNLTLSTRRQEQERSRRREVWKRKKKGK